MDGRRSTLLIFAVCGLLWAGIVLHNARNRLASDIFEPAVPLAEVEAFAKQQLADIQQRSFTEKVELCGIVAERSTGELVTREVIVGENATCDISYFDVSSLLPRATFHTHGAHDPDYDSEVPSVIDLEGDIADELDGYVSTPGGRLWHNDWRMKQARLVCGKNCLPADPAYRDCDTLKPEKTYTVASLKQREDRLLPHC